MATTQLPDTYANVVHRPPIIYYGTALPARDWAARLRNVTVVLQPYHPLCQSSEFADYFPHARRYVYFNPTAVHSRFLTEPNMKAATLGHDATWDLERLDLRCIAARRLAITLGETALRISGVNGLFVDDLDRWDQPGRRHYVYAVLRALASGRTCPTAWFVNRGFGFWKRLPGLTAALLEEISPYQLDHLEPADLSWVRTVVLPALHHASARDIEIHCLTYDPAAVGWCPRGAIASAVAALAGEPLLARRHLDHWPDILNEGTD